MTVTRTTDQAAPATLTVFYANQASADAAAAEQKQEAQKTQVIDMKNRTEGEIWAELLKATKATEVPATPEDVEEARELAEEAERSRKVAALSLEVRKQKKREEEMLRQARGEVGLSS